MDILKDEGVFIASVCWLISEGVLMDSSENFRGSVGPLLMSVGVLIDITGFTGACTGCEGV